MTTISPTSTRASRSQRAVSWLVDLVMLLGFDLILDLIYTQADWANLIVWVVYFSVLEGGPSGQTVGKRWAGIRVVRAGGAEPVGIGRAAVRNLARWLSLIPVGLGFFWMIWDSNRETWHDKISRTRVVSGTLA